MLRDLAVSLTLVLAGPALLLCVRATLIPAGLSEGNGSLTSGALPALLQSVQRLMHNDPAAYAALLGLLAALCGIGLTVYALLGLLSTLLWALAIRSSRVQVSPALITALRRMAPEAMRRLAAGALGLQLSLGLGLTGLAPAAAQALPPTIDHANSRTDPAPHTESSRRPAGPPHETRPEQPRSVLFLPTPPPAESPRLRPPEREAHDLRPGVTVRPGDSLWDIAADHLGPDADDWEIAAEWPRWWEANRTRIGDDPALLKPGTLLHAPSPRDGDL
ncbi:LysM peptidoglycan-binding domain-containing protein [Nesterenkonia flava]|uniref:LysM peptidoglycan-binding domain-containing protein n=1 Tax=Nesterenkonia flava TaxID=469799 RepID=A0ABU1FQV6_9MICC|nr:LysM peptidoglycan-binding domain-containing protein [Nesterenkonia flava]MDR5711036.1 LysM peptidoglycan-binding domain-containing protein [Nesterenkonia flava]